MVGKRFNLLALLAGVLVILAACTGPITTPEQFAFNDVDEAEPGAVITSNVVTIRGINTPAPAKVTTGGTLIIDGEEAGDSADVSPGSELAVRVTASERFGGEVSVTVDVGGVTARFTVTTRDAVSPADFELDAVTDAEPGEVVTSAPFTVSGLEAPSLATVTGDGSPQLILNGDVEGAGFTHPVDNGDELEVRLTASEEFGATRTAVIEIAGAEGIFTVTTRAAASAPDGFAFAPATGVELGEDVTSNAVTVSGLEAPAMLSVTGEGSPRLVVNGSEVDSPAEVDNGDEVQVRVTASGEFDTSVTATATLGEETADFVVTTRAAVQPMVTLSTDLDDPDNAAPGADVTLTWTVTGDYDELVLTGTPGGLNEDVTEEPSFDITIPGNVPQVSYTLTATHSLSGLEGSATSDIAIPLWVCEDPDSIITIEDGELEDSFFEQSGTPAEGPITCFDAQQLEEWETSNYDEGTAGTISSLVGMQHFVNLRTFKATYNEISDLTPLAGLEALEELNLDKNRITDLTPLRNHPSLRVLELWDNGPERDNYEVGLSDISDVATIPTLEELYLSDNPIGDISALAELENLRVLFLIRAQVESISPLSGLTGLQVLRLGHNNIENASALATLPNLAWLELEYNRLGDDALAPLGGFDHLFVVSLEGNFFTNFAPLIANDAFPAATGAPGLPPHRQQPADAEVSIGYNCMSADDLEAARTAFEGKGLVVPPGGSVKEEDLCDLYFAGSDSIDWHELRLEGIRMKQESERVR